MKPGDIIGVSANVLIQGATLDKCSHVAIVANDREVIEILPDGLRKVHYEICIKDCKSAVLYERPDHLQSFLGGVLEEEYMRLESAMTKYSVPRMLYSGFLPIARNVFYAAAIVSLCLMYFYKSPYYIPVAIIFLLYSPGVYLIQRFCSRKHRLKRFGVPEFLLKDLPGEFCSSLVVYLDKKANGVIASRINKNHEPRPSDVVRACLDLGYKAKELKSKKTSQEDTVNCASA